MDANWGIVVATLGAVPGMLALAGGLVTLGRLTQRLNTVERDVQDMKTVTAKVAVIEERTKNTDDNVKAIRSGMANLTDTLLGRAFEELRSFKGRSPADG